ncbi:DUF4430 domain-containing protein [Methanogenium marinum]|uniref:DUF4430 domain-containing protein n=1 Tax=Methanogenium marinum TaxID=348610 RepID=A0A9Q4PYB3_9EURY|nr:DUF4430 domain-containing protein [Methanogenium marinum]MDE4908353.1 DUF4430 domain-containing protein [Methanogenium marinum]
MHRAVGVCAAFLALLICVTAPAAAISILSVTQDGAGEPVMVTLDREGTVSFQYNGGTPIFAHGITVKFIPPGEGVVTFSATDPVSGMITTPRSITITDETLSPTPTPQIGGGGGGSDTPSVVWKSVTLPAGTFDVVADNSEETCAVSWQSALGTLKAAGVSFKVSDKWDGGLFIFEVDGTPSEDVAGWMYQVNGASPVTTAEKCTVSAGDKVIWYYSESMSQTPEQSPKAFYYKVQTSTAPAPGVSSTENGETEKGQDVTADAVSYPLSLPPGSDLRLSEGRMYLSVNVPMAASAGDEITFVGNTMFITREDVVLKIRFADFTDKSGVISGEITDVTVETTPVMVTCASGAAPEICLLINLMTIPMDADIDVIATPISGLSAVPAQILGAANAALGVEGKCVSTAGWQMDAEKRGLENGVDVGDVIVRITADPACITKMGGLSVLRLVHIMDDGTAEVLALRSAGTTEDGKMILEADPAAGLSSFIFVSIAKAPAASGTAVTTTAPEAQATPEPTESGTPLTALCAAVGLLAVTGIYRNKKR